MTYAQHANFLLNLKPTWIPTAWAEIHSDHPDRTDQT